MNIHTFVQFSNPIGAFDQERMTPLISLWAPWKECAQYWISLWQNATPIKTTSGTQIQRVNYGLHITSPTPPSPQAVMDGRAAGVDINVFGNVIATPRLALFDMDATLLRDETLDRLAEHWRAKQNDPHSLIAKDIETLTARAMQGTITFGQSLKERLRLLTGMPERLAMELIQEGLPLHDGTETLMRGLQQRGVACIIASGGFYPFAREVAHRLSMDSFYCNRWKTDIRGDLLGTYEDPMMDALQKQKILMQASHLRGVDLQQTMAVGDGANDLLMLQTAGLPVAWRAKPLVCQHIHTQLHVAPMSAILDWF